MITTIEDRDLLAANEERAFIEGFRIAWVLLRPGKWNEDQKTLAVQEYNQWVKYERDKAQLK
jgi:hypothetical protein